MSRKRGQKDKAPLTTSNFLLLLREEQQQLNPELPSSLIIHTSEFLRTRTFEFPWKPTTFQIPLFLVLIRSRKTAEPVSALQLIFCFLLSVSEPIKPLPKTGLGGGPEPGGVRVRHPGSGIQGPALRAQGPGSRVHSKWTLSLRLILL